jgi:hypothetical protein
VAFSCGALSASNSRYEKYVREARYRAVSCKALLCLGSVTQVPFPYLPVLWMFERTG